nr:hypothetical protein [Streptomyces lomondensis]
MYGDLRAARRIAVVVPGPDTGSASYDTAARMARDLRTDTARLAPADDRPCPQARGGGRGLPGDASGR